MTAISSISQTTLDLPPSCIAFCPAQPEYFVVGTYFLHPAPNRTPTAPNDDKESHNRDNSESGGGSSDSTEQQKRTGSLILFRLKEGGDEITHIVTKHLDSAVLDLQWSYTPLTTSNQQLLAVATSTGQLGFYKLDIARDDGADLVLHSIKAFAEQSVLVLSLAWHPREPRVIGCTFSDGSVSLCECLEGTLWTDGVGVTVTQIHQHELEAWTLAFCDSDGGDVMSGGDDVVLQCSRALGEDDQRSVVWQDRKLHNAGVTAILPLTSGLAVTGSYDDHIRLIACPAVGRRRVLAEANLGGGVWRLKLLAESFSPSEEGEGAGDGNGSIQSEPKCLTILASCMHAGTRVLRLCRGENDGAWQFELVARFEEHGSMNYGSDAQPSSGPARTIVSTSFYDKLMCLWRVDLGGEAD